MARDAVTSSVLTRALTPDDADAYVALRTEMLHDAPWAFAGSPGTGDDFASDPAKVRDSLSEPENVIHAALDGPRITATVGVLRNKRTKFRHIALIWGVYVSPAHREQGLARSLMLAAIATARSWQGVTSVRLGVSARSTGARALYESLGFTPWGVEPDCVRLPGHEHERGIDEVHMVLHLA